MTIDPEEFAQWKDNAITRYVFAAMRTYAEDQRQAFIAKFWEQGSQPDAAETERLRGQAFSALYFANATLEEIERYHTEERK